MPTQWLKNLSHKAAHVRALNPIYDFSLGRSNELLQFSTFPIDLIGGDAGRGKWLISRKIDIHGHRVSLDTPSWLIGTPYQNTVFFNDLHGFGFAADLKELGGHAGRTELRKITEAWLQDFGTYHHITWSPDLTARRLVHWMTVYPFAFETAPDDFLSLLHHVFYRHHCHLKHSLSRNPTMPTHDRLLVLWALTLTQCHCDTLYNQVDLDSYLLLFKNILDEMIYNDGGVINRQPRQALEYLVYLSTLRQSLALKGITTPLWLSSVIEKLTRFTNNMTHSDKDLPLFQDTTLPNKITLEKITRAGGQKIRRQDQTYEESGFTSIRKARTSLLIDHGHMAIEIGYAGHRLITSCGTHYLDSNWKNALSSMAAQSALTIDNMHTVTADIKPKVELQKLNSDVLFIGTYDMRHNDVLISHTRRLYIDKAGEDIRGEDIVTRDIAAHDLPLTIRFHIHPNVKVSMMNDHTGILLRLPNGVGWAFRCHDSSAIALDESVFCSNGFDIRKTHQIAIHLPFKGLNNKIKWALKRV
jgi:uncharacterized heparinase superfamily protein